MKKKRVKKACEVKPGQANVEKEVKPEGESAKNLPFAYWDNLMFGRRKKD
jgi:hypothetical protein